MSKHKALARQWRPQSFKSFVGQEHAIKAIRQSLERQEIHHAHLLTGTRGVGKTTLARLFAKGLSCQTGITGTPCEQCDHCQGIEHGTYVDLIEIDAASRTKVEDTKELLSQVHYPPVQGRYKIYLIDEVHSLSGNSFNALLKTLEEPPEHIKFILATTDPQKLPITIHSRCLQLHLQNHHVNNIQGHLEGVLQALNKTYEPEAIAQIANCAAGSMRDALSLLEQAIALSGEHLSNETVCTMLGRAEQKDIQSIIQAIGERNHEIICNILTQLEHNASNYHNVIDQMVATLYTLSQQKLLPNTNTCDWAPTQSAAQIQLYVQMLLQAKRDLDLYPDHTTGFNLTVMRMMAFTVDNQSIHQLLEKSCLSDTQEKIGTPQPTLTTQRSATSILQNSSEPKKPNPPAEKKNNIDSDRQNPIATTSSGRSASSILQAQTKKQVKPAAKYSGSEQDQQPKSITTDNSVAGSKQTENPWQTVLDHPACVGMIKQVLQQSILQSDARLDHWEIQAPENVKTIVNDSFKKRFESLCSQALSRQIVAQFKCTAVTPQNNDHTPQKSTGTKTTPPTQTAIKSTQLRRESKPTTIELSESAKSFAQSINAEPINLTPPEFQEQES